MTKILNIDDLVSESPMIIVVGGKEHAMKVPTLEDFLNNMKDLEAMAAVASVVEETEITIKMIARAIPSLSVDEIKKWPMSAIEKLFAIIREADPDAKVDEKDAEGNVPSGT